MKRKLNLGENVKITVDKEKKRTDSKDEIQKDPKEAQKKTKGGKEGVRAAGEKTRKIIKLYQLKKKLEWVKKHVLENKKPGFKNHVGPEEKKLKILLKEIEMLKKFNMLGFDSDAINLLLGLYYMVETINEERQVANLIANGSVLDEDKAASLESLLFEWWERVELLPSYKERTSMKYHHLGTKVVVKKLYSKPKFVEPLNNIINEINEYIKKRDIDGLTKAVKKADLFCEEIKKMASRPEKRRYTGPVKKDDIEKEKKKISDREKLTKKK